MHLGLVKHGLQPHIYPLECPQEALLAIASKCQALACLSEQNLAVHCNDQQHALATQLEHGTISCMLPACSSALALPLSWFAMLCRFQGRPSLWEISVPALYFICCTFLINSFDVSPRSSCFKLTNQLVWLWTLHIRSSRLVSSRQWCRTFSIQIIIQRLQQPSIQNIHTKPCVLQDPPWDQCLQGIFPWPVAPSRHCYCTVDVLSGAHEVRSCCRTELCMHDPMSVSPTISAYSSWPDWYMPVQEVQ